jgi:hypothetical protein
MSHSTYLPVVPSLPVATPVAAAAPATTHPPPAASPAAAAPAVVQAQPQAAVATPFDAEPLQPMPIVPSQMALCRSCNQSFLRHEGDRGSARYYRCRDCVGTEALMTSLMFACVVS